ncbi:hypothetical protein KC343_g1944 [Hortaea werneckii]|uniref:Rhodopsin domain-containing protein n=1 Tax=Hortaea werneckii TaxID=91943 RepID=A0A3M7HCA0_HORWE|nr:hypothetical protein KC352_g14739 [Hortaea werneckii]KAI7570794.1 hypothetical protein KC317_g2176 [Hortaea werneckii]KAI7608921.1 hypothetical protein KC346_g9404 [Hortaea werneckii]KAI7635268.1 hypothetical protein KC343_g1944 [Hortaea werneckii]KAI7681137.1 hypothetical protein KC319_g1757 [Hortaea werneckii]
MALEDRAPSVFTAVLILAVTAFMVFPLRLYVRSMKKAFGYDDWCMCIGIIPFLALTIVCLVGPFHGVGVHQASLTADEQTQGRLWFFLFEILFCITIIFIKLSISFMLARIAAPMKKYVWALWFMAGLVTLANLVSLFYIIFQCSPVAFFWDRTIPGGRCNEPKILADIYYMDTAVNIIVDWFCALLPVPLLWSIQMNRNTKISVAFLLGLGVFASLSACIRLKYTVNLNNSDDFLYGVGDVAIWGYAENATGVIVGCISTLRPLFQRLFKLGSSRDPSSGFELKNTHDRPRPMSTQGGQGAESQYSWAKNRHGKNVATVRTGQLRKSSDPSFCESEEELVQDMQKGIQVSRSVTQHRDIA